MRVFNSCKDALAHCLETKTFGVAHLYNTEKTMNIHIHDCYEIYFSLSGGNQFLINDRIHNFSSGDIFFINSLESHYVQSIEPDKHERIVLHIHPAFIKQMSSEHTNLDYCFSQRNGPQDNKRSLSEDEQKRFLCFIHELSSQNPFGQDLLDTATMIRLLVFLNNIFLKEPHSAEIKISHSKRRVEQFSDILSYINQHLTEEHTLSSLADHFFVSPSYLCTLFKKETGTTITKYITAQRITLAKALLQSGTSAIETCEKCGFKDYSNFFKAFLKAVGVSPSKYAQLSAI